MEINRTILGNSIEEGSFILEVWTDCLPSGGFVSH